MKLDRTKLAVLVASGLGSGYLPKAPGTWGSLAALPLWIIAQQSLGSGVLSEAAVIILLCIVGSWSINSILKTQSPGDQSSDPQFIVIDEWIGIFIALSATWLGDFTMILIGFLSFRLFDTWKPGPIRSAERLPGAVGIIADDVLAGICALLFTTGLSLLLMRLS